MHERVRRRFRPPKALSFQFVVQDTHKRLRQARGNEEHVRRPSPLLNKRRTAANPILSEPPTEVGASSLSSTNDTSPSSASRRGSLFRRRHQRCDVALITTRFSSPQRHTPREPGA